MTRLGPGELLDRMAEGDVTVLDVRPADEYRAGHIPVALSVPLEELERRLDGLARDREIVARHLPIEMMTHKLGLAPAAV